MFLSTTRLITTAILAVSAVQPIAASRTPLRRQIISPTLAVDFDHLSSLRIPTERFQCGPAHIVLAGRYPPFIVDVVRFPFNATDIASQEVLERLAVNISAKELVIWSPKKESEGKIAVRVVDSVGNAAYSVVKEVNIGNDRYCTDLNPPNWFFDYGWIVVLAFMPLGLFLFWIICDCFQDSRREQERKRKWAALTTSVDQSSRREGETALVPREEEREDVRLLVEEEVVPEHVEPGTA